MWAPPKKLGPILRGLLPRHVSLLAYPDDVFDLQLPPSLSSGYQPALDIPPAQLESSWLYYKLSLASRSRILAWLGCCIPQQFGKKMSKKR